MNALEEFYLKLDENGWDAKQESEINVALLNVSEALLNEGLLDVQRFAEVERQVFLFSKTPEKRLSYRAKGTRTTEDGKEVPYEWPNLNDFFSEDFSYLYNRFTVTKNIYAKTEYGLVLYYSKNKQNNDFAIELLDCLFSLIKSYIDKAKLIEDRNHYILYARGTLANALFIANNRKEDLKVNDRYKSLIEFTFETHQNWDITHSATLRTIIDFTDFAIEYYSGFKNEVSITKIIDKNWEAAKYLSDTYVWGAIYVADISIRLCRKLNLDSKDWVFFKAQQYEKLYEEAQNRNNNMVAISFIEKAMGLYKNIKDSTNLDRLRKLYQQTRNDYELGEINIPLPEDENERIIELIKREVNEFKEDDIIQILLFTPTLKPLEEIKKESEEFLKTPSLSNIIPTSILDKFGNTIAKMSYFDRDILNNREDALIRTYGFHMQIAVQTIVQYFIEAFRADKISAKGIINYLEKTWIGKDSIRRIFGQNVNISYLKLIESGINTFFRELNLWKNEADYLPDMISATDSLVLKTEYTLREFSNSLGIHTFKQNPKETGIIMEKTLDDILRDLANRISEDDLFFMKFILIEKAGYNLRNKIAHGLMDNIEYGLDHPILALIIILKLSNYEIC